MQLYISTLPASTSLVDGMEKGYAGPSWAVASRAGSQLVWKVALGQQLASSSPSSHGEWGLSQWHSVAPWCDAEHPHPGAGTVGNGSVALFHGRSLW